MNLSYIIFFATLSYVCTILWISADSFATICQADLCRDRKIHPRQEELKKKCSALHTFLSHFAELLFAHFKDVIFQFLIQLIKSVFQ